MDYLAELHKHLHIMPEQASAHAGRVDDLFLALGIYSVLLLAILVILIVYFGIRYRAGSPGGRTGPNPSGHWPEITFASVLFVTFLGFFIWGGELYLDIYRGPKDATTINVVGKQWMWKVEHPDGTREINTLHVPVGETFRLRLSSQDVIHSFFVPALRLKRDAVPGMHNTAWFTATRPGTYHLLCAEYCGTDHSRMRGKVVVMSRADYQDWLTRQGHGAKPAVLGKQLFHSHGCSGCHMGKANVRCPDLAGIYGRTVPLAKGNVIMVDEAYIRDSILQPSKQIVAGYAPIMPSFSGRISEGELQNIIAYIRSLRPGEWELENTR